MRRKTWRTWFAVVALTLSTIPAWAELGPKGSEIRVNQRTDFKQRNPAVAFSPSGGALVVWENDQRGVRGLLYGKDGQPAGTELTLIANQAPSTLPAEARTFSRRQPAVAFLSENTFGLIWTEEVADMRAAAFIEQRNVVDQDVYYQRFNTAGAAIGERVRVNSTAEGFQREPRLFVRGRSVLAVWEDANGGIFGRWLGGARGQFRINEEAGTLTNVALGNGGSGGSGRFLAVWEGQDGSETGVFARLFDNAGTAITSPFRVNSDITGRQRRPTVAAAGGDFLVVWQTDLAKTESHLFAQVVGSAGNLIGGQIALDAGPESGRVQMAPAVAALSSDRFLVTWMAWPNGRAGLEIAGRELDATGTPLGDPFWVTERRIERNFRGTSISSDGKGAFLVAWETVTGGRAGIGARWLQTQ